jgi:hypothetical protein
MTWSRLATVPRKSETSRAYRVMATPRMPSRATLRDRRMRTPTACRARPEL